MHQKIRQGMETERQIYQKKMKTIRKMRATVENCFYTVFLAGFHFKLNLMLKGDFNSPDPILGTQLRIKFFWDEFCRMKGK